MCVACLCKTRPHNAKVSWSEGCYTVAKVHYVSFSALVCGFRGALGGLLRGCLGENFSMFLQTNHMIERVFLYGC